ncbi:unnamed protein product [Allacma fusca]|uniref:Pseudouridine synthase I TruA alpha/beta domain-containing protein n=1 Tax=Allacma fusca TaxID=39272 RepID=A0A8J2NMC0_9HEXA|nr:unnamed protein product [Allacma fusca]
MDLEIEGEDYNKMTREDLIEKIRKLSCHVKQLRNVVKRDTADDIRSIKKARRNRAFDFSKHPKRHVALKVAYLGWDYQGLAVQEDTDNTIEAHVFLALTKSKLIQDRSTSNYHRCGRTDKGVSAFCQVLSIDLRCKCNAGLGVITSQLEDSAQNEKLISDLALEIDYCKILNAILPKEIRVLAWAPVSPEFSARFDCKERMYRYLIPAGDADLNAMRRAGAYLIGEHNFQNFCKVDTSGEKTTIRRIISFKMSKCSPPEDVQSCDQYCIYEMEICGQSFLWHQIRCIVAVLILVGKGLEEPEIVRDLLDLEKMPKKPQYSMAMDFPLVLFDTHHGSEIKEWISSPENTYHVITDLQTMWSQHALKAQMVLGMLKSLECCSSGAVEQTDFLSKSVPHRYIPACSSPSKIPTRHLDCLVMGTKTKIYKPLSQRPVCAKVQNSSSECVGNSTA